MNGISSITEMKLEELAIKNKLYCNTWLLINKLLSNKQFDKISLLQNNSMMENALYKP